MLMFLGVQSLFPTLPLYVAAIGGTPVDNGLAVWVFSLAALLTRAWAGVLADRWGRKPVLVLGAFLFGAGPTLYSFASNVPLLLVIRAVHGVGMAFFVTAYQALIVDMLPPGRYGEGLGLANVAMMATMVIAPPLGEWMVQGFGFRTLFLSLGAAGGVGALITFILPGHRRSGGDPSRSGQTGLRHVLRQSGVRIGAMGMLLLGMPAGAFIGFLPLLAAARGLGETGLVFSIQALASSLTQPVTGRLADRWGALKVAAVGLSLVSVVVAGLGVAFGRWTVLGLAILYGIGSGAAMVGLTAAVQGSVGASLRGSASAVQFTAFDLVIGLGSLGLGWLAGATSYGVMYVVAGGISLLGLAVWVVEWSRRPEPGLSST